MLLPAAPLSPELLPRDVQNPAATAPRLIPEQLPPAAAKNLVPAIRVMLSLAAIMLLLTLEPQPRHVPSPAATAHLRIRDQEMMHREPAHKARVNRGIRCHNNVRCKEAHLRNIVLRDTINPAPAMNLLLRNTETTAKPECQESPVRHGPSKASRPARQPRQVSRPGSSTER